MSDDEHTQLPGPSEQETESHASVSGTSERIGPYRLLQRIGEGGMGEVWEAEQEKPLRRRVALKLIKLGMDSKAVIARFEAERQALAMMDHPNVAKVFDAGTTGQGRPYFVMEYVHGVPLTEHCDRHRLDNRERLQLYRQICEGVQHAHQKAIIHRDIKPSNVLVSIQDGKAMPKIIDFGVAKAISQKLTERTLFTAMGQLVGTPEYMSPEQAEMTGQDVDTRTDVYSLGVMLYELLTGALPFDPKELREAGFDEIRRRIREEEPSRPSTKISTLGEAATGSAKNRRTDVGALRKQLTGDLDWITMKALEKDRCRRYASPQELAADVERHLKDEPVLAGPPSAAYRAKKFVRRHKVGVGVAAAGLMVLIAFAGAMAYQTNRIAHERDRANLERDRANQERDRANQRWAAGLGLSEGIVRDAVELSKRVRGDDHPETLFSMGYLAYVVSKQHRYDEAEALYLETLEIQKHVLGDDHRRTALSKGGLAELYVQQGRYDEAEAQYREIIETKTLGHDSVRIAIAALANLEAVRGNPSEAMDWLRQKVDDGSIRASQLLEDPTFKPIHGPEFDALVERARQNAAAQEQ